MRVVLQRTSEASVSINNEIKSEIKNGILVLVGIENEDSSEDIEWLTNKICNLRIFDDCEGVMNLSLKDIDGELLVISQFTLHAKTKKGNRPSYINAAKPAISIPIYQEFISSLEKELNKKVKTGEFGANMQIKLINDGPVTIIIDSKNRK